MGVGSNGNHNTFEEKLLLTTELHIIIVEILNHKKGTGGLTNGD